MTDATDFSAPELAAINAMMRASKTLPDDMWAVAAVQNLACLYARIEPLLPEADKAMLIGIGGYVAHLGKAEMMAEIQAGMAIARARAKPAT
jgi:hypothetical protein